MTRIIINSHLLVVGAMLSSVLFADVAPPVFPGYSLSLFASRSVKITSEKIDIYYGTTCRIEAVYEILNPTKETVERKIGFPFKPNGSNGWSRDTAIIYDFVLNLNGVNQRVSEAHLSSQLPAETDSKYGWTCRFKPGQNIVKLTYHTIPGYSSSGYAWEKSIYYHFGPDTAWTGKIDTVKVTIHFPEPLVTKQILAETSPAGFKIKDKEIRWEFSSFTPKRNQYIALHLIDPQFFANMNRYEKVLSAIYSDNETKLKAAKFFASLAPDKGIYISAPTFFKRSYYDSTVLANLGPLEQVLFRETYKLNKNFGQEDYYSTKSGIDFFRNDTLRNAVITIMKRIGYYENVQYPVIYKYIEGAKRLFREVVTSDPKNASAWIAYIDNCYYIESGSCNPCLPWARYRDCSDLQKQVVLEAFQNCGNDSIIALWHNFLFPATFSLPTLQTIRYSSHPQHEVKNKFCQDLHRLKTNKDNKK